jgi:DNA-binding winged helix-turn-helix (wHTH) protein
VLEDKPYFTVHTQIAVKWRLKLRAIGRGQNHVKFQERIRFGEDFELDPRSFQLRRGGRAVKLERIPMEILIQLVERAGHLVTREEITERVWGKNVYLDSDNSLNSAIRKIRQALRDDPEQPRFVQTVVGRGYLFVASPLINSPGDAGITPSPSHTV